MDLKRFSLLTLFFLLYSWSKLNAQQCGTVDQVTQSGLTASSSAGSNTPSFAGDGTMTTYWQPIYSVTSNYLIADLGSTKQVCQVILWWNYTQFPTGFKIEGADNINGTWVELYSITSGNNPELLTNTTYNEWKHQNTIAIPSTPASNKRYIRVWVGEQADPSWRLGKFLVFTQESTQNSPPTTNLTYPAIPISVPLGAILTLSADAIDPGGSITQVSFYNGENLLGNAPQTYTGSTQGPYTHQWAPPSVGTYLIKSKATDNLNAVGFSSVVTVEVTANAGAWSLSGNDLTGISDPFIGSRTNSDFPIVFKTSGLEKMRIATDGKVFIGTPGFPSSVPSDALLAVKGFIVSKGLKVTQVNWPDYVFEKDYKLMPLPQLADFIRKNKHLPGVPSVKQVSVDGVNIGENQEIILKKIEELTLYLIEQNKRIEELQRELNKLKAGKKE